MKLMKYLFLALWVGSLWGCNSTSKTSQGRSITYGYTGGSRAHPKLDNSNEWASVEGDLYEEKQKNAEGEAKVEQRKVIFDANMSLVVASPDSANKRITAMAKELGGYVNEVGTSRTIIRVKAENLDAAMERLSKLGKVNDKSLRGEDVTETYFDLRIRLDNAEKSRKRYLQLLDKATTVDEILKVEKELERLNETIDRIKGRLSRIDHLDEFSTITIYLQERKKPGILGYVAIGVYHSVKWLFVRN